MYIDSHSHWSDPRFPHFSSFGLHPCFVSKTANADCELALDQLVTLMDKSMAIGETGLDFRDKVLKQSDFDQDEIVARQIEFFENQIELSKVYKKPLILHIVQAHEKALQIFDMWGAPEKGGMVHAFSGSFETAQKYINLGFHISVAHSVTYEKNQKLRSCIEKIPVELLLFESNDPDQVHLGNDIDTESSSLWQIACAVADIKKVKALDVMKISTENFKKLFSL